MRKEIKALLDEAEEIYGNGKFMRTCDDQARAKLLIKRLANALRAAS
jgi:hypothetical protein